MGALSPIQPETVSETNFTNLAKKATKRNLGLQFQKSVAMLMLLAYVYRLSLTAVIVVARFLLIIFVPFMNKSEAYLGMLYGQKNCGGVWSTCRA